MTAGVVEHLACIRAYLQALESGATGEALACWFTPDALQMEMPSRLNPKGASSDLTALLVRAGRARELLRSQRYEIVSEIAQDDRVAIEVVWRGVLAVAYGSLAAGSVMTAHCALWFRLRDGRIWMQRNYDCFEGG